MRPLLKLVSLAALVATLLPSVLFFTGTLSHPAVNTVALIGTLTWFVFTPMWMGRTPADDTTVATKLNFRENSGRGCFVSECTDRAGDCVERGPRPPHSIR